MKTKMSVSVSWKLRLSRIDAEAPADCSIVLVRLQRNYGRRVSSCCVCEASRMDCGTRFHPSSVATEKAQVLPNSVVEREKMKSDLATDRSLCRLFVPWTVRTETENCVKTVRTVLGLFVPWTIRTITGRFVPCWERRHSLYSASQPPWGFLVIFPKRLGVFSPNFTCLLHVPTYGKLQIFVQLSPTLTKLCHINCDHPACVSANGGYFEHDGGRAEYGITSSKLEIIE